MCNHFLVGKLIILCALDHSIQHQHTAKCLANKRQERRGKRRGKRRGRRERRGKGRERRERKGRGRRERRRGNGGIQQGGEMYLITPSNTSTQLNVLLQQAVVTPTSVVLTFMTS